MEKFDVDEFTFESLVGVLEKGVAMQNDIEEYLRPYNISHGRFSILLTLYGYPDYWLSPTFLAKKLRKTKPTITGMMKKLIKNRMVIEKIDEDDARRKMYQLAPEGYDLLKKIIPKYNKRIIEIGSTLTLEEKVQLKRIVGKINI